MDLTSLSKFLSYVLRHHPESIDLEVDPNGWVAIDELISKAQEEGKPINRDTIDQIMSQGSKQRFILSDNHKYIRASYGHSIDVDLQLKPKEPPQVLYHGTARRNVDSIMRQGIKPGSRNFVHLSATVDEAKGVGSRHGKPVILKVNTEAILQQGQNFYQAESEPGIWLTKKVPPEFVNPVE